MRRITHLHGSVHFTIPLKVKMSFIFIIFDFLNQGFTCSFFHLKLRIWMVLS